MSYFPKLQGRQITPPSRIGVGQCELYTRIKARPPLRFSIIGSCSIGDLLFEVLSAANVVMRRWQWQGRKRKGLLASEFLRMDSTLW